MPGFLDTNALVRLMVGDVVVQQRLVEKLLATGGAFQVSDLAITELVYVLEKGYIFPRDFVARSVNALLSNNQLRTNRALFQRALPLYTHHSALSFVDCCLVIQAKLQRSLPLWTFDRKLVAQSAGIARLID